MWALKWSPVACVEAFSVSSEALLPTVHCFYFHDCCEHLCLVCLLIIAFRVLSLSQHSTKLVDTRAQFRVICNIRGHDNAHCNAYAKGLESPMRPYWTYMERLYLKACRTCCMIIGSLSKDAGDGNDDARK